MLKRYALAVALTGAAALLTHVLAPVLDQSMFILYLAAIVVAAWHAGFPAAFLCLALSLAAVFLIHFPMLLVPSDRHDLARLAIFSLVTMLASWLTARRRAIGLRQHANEELYNAIMARESDGIVILGTGGRVRDVNAGAASMLGYTREQMRGMRILDLTHPDEMQEAEQRVERAFHEGHVESRERRLRRADGVYMVVEGSGSRISNDRAILIFRDLTERRHAAAALQESERRLRLIAENTADVIYAFDMERRLIYVNPAFERATGYTVAELRGGALPSLLHPEDEERWQRLCVGLFAGRSIRDEEIRILTRAGEVRWLLCSWGPLFDEQGRQIGVQGRDHDITERKQVEQALRESEARFHLLAENASDLITIAEADGRYIYLSPSVEATLGFPASEMLGHRLEEFLHPDDAARFGDCPGPDGGEIRLRTADGSWLWMEGSTYEINVGLKGYVVGIARDITARRQTEQALRRNEEILRLAQRSADAGAWEWDIATGEIFWSDIYYELYGVDPSTTPSFDAWLATIHPDDRERIARMVEATVQERRDLSIEFRIIHPERGTRWMTALGRTHFNAAGEPVRMAGIAMDVTSRRDTEQALRESEQRLRVALVAGNVGVWDWDIERDRIEWSEHIYSFHGLRPEEFDGTIESFIRLIHPEDLEPVRALIEQAIRERTRYEAEFRIIRPDGELRWLTTSGQALYAEDGRALRMLGATADVTERKKAEQAERQARSLAETAMKRSAFLADASAILASSLDHDATLSRLAHLAIPYLADYCVILEVLDGGSVELRATAHVEPEKEHLILRAAELVTISGDDPGPTGTVLRTGQPVLIPEYSGEAEYWRSLDPEMATIFEQLRPGSLMIQPITSYGRLVGVLLLGMGEPGRRFRDDDMALGEDLARRAGAAIGNARLYHEAREANAAKDRFLAVLSHELRTPLTPALAAVHALREESPEDMLPFVEVIGRNIELEARLIDDLLDLTRIIKGKLSLDMRPVSVHELLQNALEICRADVKAKGLMVMLDLTAGNDRVEGDAARLQQVFWNLLKNGVKFTPSGGQITIRTAELDGRIAIEVADTGIGIEPSMAEAIFTAFVQGEPDVTRRYGGLGLGLAISRSIVEMHGGAIRAASPGPGLGSTFTVEISLVPAEERVPVTAPAGSATSGRAQDVKVLVIDDHRDGDGLVRLLAEERGLRLYTVYDAALAEQVAAAHQVDLVVGSVAAADGDARVERILGSGRHRTIVVRDGGDRARGVAPDVIAGATGIGGTTGIAGATGIGGSATLIRPVTARLLRDTIEQMIEENEEL